MDFDEMQRIKEFVTSAVEASVLEAPLAPGLNYLELVTLGEPNGCKKGQIERHLPMLQAGNDIVMGPGGRYVPSPMVAQTMCGCLGFVYEPDPVNRSCLAFIQKTLKAIADDEGDASAQLERSVLVHRAEAEGLPNLDTEAAITLLLLAEALIEKNGIVRYRPGQDQMGRPLKTPGQPLPKALLTRLRGPVRDVVARRSDGRPTAVEPLRAFEERLAGLGFQKFQAWWRQTVIELNHMDAHHSPISTVVLSASLCEATLIFAGVRARAMGKPLRFRDAEKQPRFWRMDQLATAAKNGDNSILTPQTADRCIELNRMRQRVHMSRLIDTEDNPPTPDTNPQEARDARATTDMVVGQVLKWLEANPA